MERTQDSKGQIAPLTSLRFFAAVAVITFHSGSHRLVEIVPGPIAILLRNGFLGVTFFFVLSGFILQHVYSNSLDDPSNRVKYAVARLARIYPVYLLALAATALFTFQATPLAIPQIFLLQHWPISGPSPFLNWNMQAWTLSVELLFYLLFPWLSPIIGRLSRRSLPFVIGASVVVILTLRTSWIVNNGQVAGTWMGSVPVPILRLPEFLFGMALGAAFNHSMRLRVRPEIFAIGVLVIAASGSSPLVAAGVTIMAGALIFAVAGAGQSHFMNLLSWKPIVLLGGASYALYLLALPVRLAFTWLGMDSTFGLLFYLPVLAGVSILVFLWFEEPLRRSLRQWPVKSAPRFPEPA